MSFYFTKLASSILESTVWCEPLPTRVVWIALLAMADRGGRVWASIPGLAKRAGVTVEQAEAALARFLAPDRYSRTLDHEGRRIEPIEGGWKLLNYQKYRDMRDEEARKEQNREAQKRHRQRLNVSNHADNQPQSAQAEAEAEAEADVQVLSTLKMDDGVVKPVADATGGSASAPHNGSRHVVPPCPQQEIIELYAKHLPMGRQVQFNLWNNKRASHLKARWRELRERQSLNWWDQFFAHCARSSFLTGKITSSPGRPPFEVSLDWLLKPENITKVCEGVYDERRAVLWTPFRMPPCPRSPSRPNSRFSAVYFCTTQLTNKWLTCSRLRTSTALTIA